MDEHDRLLKSSDKPAGLSLDTPTKQDAKNSDAAILNGIRSSSTRWFILVLSILTSYGPYFCYDNPQPLQYYIKQIFNIQDTQFNLLYSISIAPNIIFPFIGGVIIDSLGIRFTMIITGVITVMGQFVVTIGAYIYNFETIVIGRCIFGIGSITLENSLVNIVAKWFSSRELTLSFGLIRALLPTSSALNSFLSPRLYIWTGELYSPFLCGLILNVVSLAAVFALCYIDKKVDEQLSDTTTASFSEKISLRDLKNLPRLYFLILALGGLLYTIFSGFTNNVNSLFISRFGFNSENAGSLITIIYLVAAVVSPIIGYLVDHVGKRVQFLSLSALVIFLTSLFFTFLDDRQQGNENYGVIVGLVGVGFFYAVMSTIWWTSFAFIADASSLGTAIGIASSVTAVFQAIYPEVLGVIHDNTMESHNGYYYTQVAHCVVSAVCLLVAGWSYHEDIKTDRRLEKVYMKVEEKDS